MATEGCFPPSSPLHTAFSSLWRSDSNPHGISIDSPQKNLNCAVAPKPLISAIQEEAAFDIFAGLFENNLIRNEPVVGFHPNG